VLGTRVVGTLIRRVKALTEGFLSDVDLRLGENLAGTVGFVAPFEPVNEPSTVACFGQPFDATSKLPDQFFRFWIILTAGSLIKIVAESANIKRNS
jgi:hypothetical protein